MRAEESRFQEVESQSDIDAEDAAALLSDRRDVKVKLPAALVLRLYYLKLTTSLNYSDVVEDALVEYFRKVDAESGVAPGLEALGGIL